MHLGFSKILSGVGPTIDDVDRKGPIGDREPRREKEGYARTTVVIGETRKEHLPPW